MLYHQEMHYHKSMKTIAKIRELHFKLLRIHRIRQIWRFYLFVDLNRIVVGKTFGSNEEVNAEVKAYFASKKNIEVLELCIALEGNCVDERSRIFPKNCCFNLYPTDFSTYINKRLLHLKQKQI